MKKVGIITLNGYFNFGNRLQNYALTKILESYDLNVYTIWKKSYKDIIRDGIKSKLFFVKKYNRYRKFYKFSKKNMKELIINDKNISNIDYFVVGSDQVWNYKLIDKDKTWFQAPTGKITISYAASLGTNSFPEDFGYKLKEQLKYYDAISVRENRGKELLQPLLPNKKIEVIIDPTLLVDTNIWKKIAKHPKNKVPEKYIFIYFLGNISNEYFKKIKDFSIKNGCSIINILDPKSEFYDVGPEEFLYLIKNSYLVCTDSFHASVFSFKFDIPFVIFKRSGEGISNDLYSRLENLLNLFKMENREYNGIEISKENLNHDYTKAYEVLEKEREKSMNFLKNALFTKKDD